MNLYNQIPQLKSETSNSISKTDQKPRWIPHEEAGLDGNFQRYQRIVVCGQAVHARLDRMQELLNQAVIWLGSKEDVFWVFRCEPLEDIQKLYTKFCCSWCFFSLFFFRFQPSRDMDRVGHRHTNTHTHTVRVSGFWVLAIRIQRRASVGSLISSYFAMQR